LGDKDETTPEEFLESMNQRFPGADEIIYSCCYPDEARVAFQGSEDKPLIIGSGSVEYKTVHNSRKNFITVSSAA